MKILRHLKLNVSKAGVLTIIACAAMMVAVTPNYAAEPASATIKRSPTVGVVNFKTCVEQSKIGKQEQSTFESMKKQMESILEEKEKTLNDIATKFNDPDYLDSLAPEAETELKRKFRALSQELQQQQQQYFQTLQQANYKIIQKLSEYITSASAEVAKEKKLDVILNQESAFFATPDLDVSTAVVAKMDEAFDKDAKEKAQQPAQKAADQPAMNNAPLKK